METMETIEREDARKRVIVSYDVDGARRSLRSKVYRMVFGYKTTKGTGTTRKVYRYTGFADQPGFQHLGQSVIALRPRDAERLRSQLGELGIKNTGTPVLFLE
ncbi:MAG: hypothetical protein ACE5KQ_06135 [Thermoplasmata archaeon]